MYPCPKCSSYHTARSHRHGAEKLVPLYRPYRCLECHHRFWQLRQRYQHLAPLKKRPLGNSLFSRLTWRLEYRFGLAVGPLLMALVVALCLAGGLLLLLLQMF